MEKEENQEVEWGHSAFPNIDSTSNVKIVWNPGNVEFNCIFCKRPTVDELKLGPLYRLPDDGVVTHYFCMLFSAGLIQRGDDRQGILGFLPDDIFKEARRAQRLKCTYCHISGASIGCNTSRCKVSFHFPCGLANEANFQFFRNYQAFCRNHTALPEITIPLSERECPICLSLVEPPELPIVGPCCRTAIFHKLCLQKLALNAGYFFKCPTCNSGEVFADSAKIQGTFVPEQDASWERDPDAYQDLYKVYNHCDAENCACPKGRDYGASKGSWLLARCRVCGSAGVHRTCGKLATIANWACAMCAEIEARVPKDKKTTKSVRIEEPVPSTSAGSTSTFNSASRRKSTTVSSNRKSKGTLPAMPSELKTKNSRTALSASKTKSVTSSSEEKTEPAPKRAKRTGVPMGMDSEDDYIEEDDFDLSKVQIMASCRDFFPHSRELKKRLAEQDNIFPDWRQYKLRVEVVNVFADAFPKASGLVEAKSTTEETVSQPVTEKDADTEFVFVKPKISRNKSRKRGSRKNSNWSKGWLKRKKRPASKPKRNVGPETNETSSQLLSVTAAPPQSQLPVGQTSDILPSQPISHVLIPPQQNSSFSQGILVGIRRSQESLLQLQAQTSNKIDDCPTATDSRRKGRNSSKSIVESDDSESIQKTTHSSETTGTQEDSNSAAETANGEHITPQNEESHEITSENHPTDIGDNEGLITTGDTGSAACNAESSLLSDSSTCVNNRSQSVNGVSLVQSQVAISDKPILRVEVDEHDEQNCSNSNGHPNLAFVVHESPQEIARNILDRKGRNEVEAQLNMFAMKLPQLFNKSNS